MLILIDENSQNFPEDFYTYGKTQDNKLIGWTKDDNFKQYEILEIPTNIVEYYIPNHDGKTYITYEKVKEILNKLKPDLINELRDKINEERDRLCYTPIPFAGYTFKADKISQQDITDAALLAMYIGPTFRKIWLALEGAVELTYEMMLGLKKELGTRREKLVYEANEMKQMLEFLEYEELIQFKINFKSYPILEEYKHE